MQVFQQLSLYYERQSKYFAASSVGRLAENGTVNHLLVVRLYDIASLQSDSSPYLAVRGERFKLQYGLHGDKPAAWVDPSRKEPQIVVDVDNASTEAEVLWNKAQVYRYVTDEQLSAQMMKANTEGRPLDFYDPLKVLLLRRQFGATLQLPKDQFIAQVVPGLLHQRVAIEMGRLEASLEPDLSAMMNGLQNGGMFFYTLRQIVEWNSTNSGKENQQASRNILQTIVQQLYDHKMNCPEIQFQNSIDMSDQKQTNAILGQITKLTGAQTAELIGYVQESLSKKPQAAAAITPTPPNAAPADRRMIGSAA